MSGLAFCRLAFLTLLAGVVCSCAAEPASPQFKFVFESEGCDGPCPEYRLQVGATGIANLVERKEEDEENHYRGEIAPERLRDLIRIHRIFKTGVVPPSDGFRIVSIELVDGDQSRFVRGTAAGGYATGTPRDPLYSFSEAIDDLVEETQWTSLEGVE